MNFLPHKLAGLALALLLTSLAGPAAALAEDENPTLPAPAAPPAPPVVPAPSTAARVLKDGSRDAFAIPDGLPERRETVWLGVGVDETTEPLAAQLGLKNGEGLVVSYVSTNSPAAGAGLKKNDVLVGLDGQMLVDATQLKKLIQMHAAGDSIKIEYYRAGKKESVSATVAKQTGDGVFGGDDFEAGGRDFWLRLNDRPDWPMARDQKVNIEIQRAMEGAQRTLQQALQQSLNGPNGMNAKLETLQKKLGHLADGGVKLDKKATVIVKNDAESVRTMVKKDESGTYVIVADPAKRLTAHDPSGKLLYDGEIESAEQQRNVPPEVWKKVEPMLKDLNRDPLQGSSAHSESKTSED